MRLWTLARLLARQRLISCLSSRHCALAAAGCINVFPLQNCETQFNTQLSYSQVLRNHNLLDDFRSPRQMSFPHKKRYPQKTNETNKQTNKGHAAHGPADTLAGREKNRAEYRIVSCYVVYSYIFFYFFNTEPLYRIFDTRRHVEKSFVSRVSYPQNVWTNQRRHMPFVCLFVCLFVAFCLSHLSNTKVVNHN